MRISLGGLNDVGSAPVQPDAGVGAAPGYGA